MCIKPAYLSCNFIQNSCQINECDVIRKLHIVKAYLNLFISQVLDYGFFSIQILRSNTI